MENPYDLSGKVALVTGGSRGLGREMIMAFAKAGANVAIVSRKLEGCEETAKEVEATTGQQAFAHAVHVGNWQDVEAMVTAVYQRFGKIDILVNNAGMSPLYDKVENVTEALYDKVLDVNLKGPFRLMAMIGSRMAEGDGGSIINISSVAALNPSAATIPYGAAKAALNSMTAGFAHAFGPKVRVNSIVAGPFLTDISKAWDMEKFNAQASQRMALQRGGEPEEIVGAAMYFASQASSFTTGSTLRVDGGDKGT